MKSFKSALQKRVKNKNKGVQSNDKFAITKVINDILKDKFGEVGLLNLKVKKNENGLLVIKCFSSVWRSELMMNKDKLLRDVNKKLKEKVVKKIKID